MKTTTWLCPVLTFLCATKLVYTAQRSGSYGGGYPLDDMDSNMMLQNDYFLSKRNKPSLSIVNPLDVLRQRLLLEIARRQMKENTRQVELNRAILKNVGKRMLSKHPYPLASALLNIQESQQQQQLQQEPMQQQQPYELELIPTTLIFDYLQQQEQEQQREEHQQRRPWLPYESTAIQFENSNNIINDFNDAIEDGNDNDDNDGNNDVNVGGGDRDNIAANGIFGNNEKHSMKHMKQSNNDHTLSSPSSSLSSSPSTTNEHETNFKKTINRNIDTKRLNVLNHSNSNGNNEGDNSAADYQVQRYLYHLHKNHLTRK